jgi:carboxymethylenebutenolidase
MFFRFMTALLLLLLAAAPVRAEPETVYFKSADGQTELVGYLFKPKTSGPSSAIKGPAIVLLHGRAGPYSANVNKDCTSVARGLTSPCNAATLSKRHTMWGEFWAARGVTALLPDSFGPRDKAHGFGRFTHGDPDRDEVNEKTVLAT